MTSTVGSTQPNFAAGRWHNEPSVDAMPHPTDLDQIIRRSSFGNGAFRALARFLIMFCIGVAATLAWQSYGDAARVMIADSSPQLGWLAPPAPAALAQTAPNTVEPAAPAAPSPEVQQLTTISL